MNANAKVEMYYKEACPYCVRARNLLQSKGVVIDEYPAASDRSLFQEMRSRSNGSRTFPQIFINGQHVGGCDNLHDLEASGELDKLLFA